MVMISGSHSGGGVQREAETGMSDRQEIRTRKRRAKISLAMAIEVGLRECVADRWDTQHWKALRSTIVVSSTSCFPSRASIRTGRIGTSVIARAARLALSSSAFIASTLMRASSRHSCFRPPISHTYSTSRGSGVPEIIETNPLRSRPRTKRRDTSKLDAPASPRHVLRH